MTRPNAFAIIKGDHDHPHIHGTVKFRQTPRGVLVSAEISGLPTRPDKLCEGNVFGFHIHEGKKCEGNSQDPFADAMSHYDPNDCPHPSHSGDLPPLFGNRGYAQMSFLTNRFNVREIIGRVVIIHDRPDDFTSQPSGNSGNKIACGVIRAM